MIRGSLCLAISLHVLVTRSSGEIVYRSIKVNLDFGLTSLFTSEVNQIPVTIRSFYLSFNFILLFCLKMPVFLSDFYRWNSFGIFLAPCYNWIDTFDKCKKNNYHPNNRNFEKGGRDVHPLSFYSSLLLSSLENDFCCFIISRIYFAHFFAFHLCDWSRYTCLKSWKNIKLNIVCAILQMQV